MARLSIYGVFMVGSNWWTYDLTVFLAGILGVKALAAQTIVSNIEFTVAAVRLTDYG